MDWALNIDAARRDPVAALRGYLWALDRQYRPAGDGEPLDGFSFLYDAREMLDVSREIERDISASGERAKLYAGFQNASKFEAEQPRYAALRAAGVAVHAFGEGMPGSAALETAEGWYELPADHSLLENQWYLVAKRPSPIAFVGWEVSDDPLWGEHGITHPGKRFAGFVSGDPRIVQALTAHLDAVRAARRAETAPFSLPVAPATPPAPRPATEGGTLGELLSTVGATGVLAFVDDGKKQQLQRTLERLVQAEGVAARSIYLYDLASASYLVDPYKWPEDRRPLEAEYVERALGRPYLAEQLRAVASHAPEPRALLASGVGFRHIAEWTVQGIVDAVVVPSEYERPGLLDRVGGYTMEALRRLGVPVLLDEPDGGARLLDGRGETREPALARLAGAGAPPRGY